MRIVESRSSWLYRFIGAPSATEIRVPRPTTLWGIAFFFFPSTFTRRYVCVLRPRFLNRQCEHLSTLRISRWPNTVQSRRKNGHGLKNATPDAMSADEGGNASTMPSTNGEINPSTSDPSALATPGKRKRGSAHDDKSAQEASSPATESQEKEKLQENLRNLVEILSKCALPDRTDDISFT